MRRYDELKTKDECIKWIWDYAWLQANQRTMETICGNNPAAFIEHVWEIAKKEAVKEPA